MHVCNGHVPSLVLLTLIFVQGLNLISLLKFVMAVAPNQNTLADSKGLFTPITGPWSFIRDIYNPIIRPQYSIRHHVCTSEKGIFF